MIAIALILACTSVAWFILAGTVYTRTFSLNDKLKPGVAGIWGAPQVQAPPSASYAEPQPKPLTDSKAVYLTPESSRVQVALALDHRQKGLLWYSTYGVDFSGTYVFRNPTDQPRQITFQLHFPVEKAVYDNAVMEINGTSRPFSADAQTAATDYLVEAGQTVTLRVGYHSQGMDTWRYRLGNGVSQSRDFQLSMRTNFQDIDFPSNTLAPTAKHETNQGWDLTWRYQNLISGYEIGMTMPEKLQPGPIAGEISYFAPVSLLLFFFLIFIITTLRNIELHPMNYFFLAAAFFSFHLLLAYLADHISIHLAFLICSAVSLFLVVSYLRLVVGAQFALLEAGGAQLVYLVLFSYAFFFKGLTGLAITIGCIVTLFLVMQLTARIRWSDRFHT